MEVNLKGDEALFRGKLLVLPAEGYGNVGQLAVDMIIYNARLECMGSLSAPRTVLPCVGSDPYDATANLSSELQIYTNDIRKIFVLQQRGCTSLGRQAAFATALTNFIQAAQFEKVLMLGSLKSVEGTLKAQNAPAAPRYKSSCTEAFNLDGTAWQELEEMDPERSTPFIDQQIPPFPFFRAAKAHGLPVCLLLIPVNEGDNSADAKALATAGAQIFEHTHPIGLSEWDVPPSWVVFGRQRVIY